MTQQIDNQKQVNTFLSLTRKAGIEGVTKSDIISIWNDADKNNDGKVTDNELMNAFKSEYKSIEKYEDEFLDALSAWDKDGNNVISEKEKDAASDKHDYAQKAVKNRENNAFGNFRTLSKGLKKGKTVELKTPDKMQSLDSLKSEKNEAVQELEKYRQEQDNEFKNAQDTQQTAQETYDKAVQDASSNDSAFKELQDKKQENKTAIDSAKGAVETTKSSVTSVTSSIEGLKGNISNKENELNDLPSTIPDRRYFADEQSYNEAVEASQNRVKIQQEIEALKSDLSQKEDELANLESQLIAQEDELAGLELERNDIESEIADFTKDNDDYKAVNDAKTALEKAKIEVEKKKQETTTSENIDKLKANIEQYDKVIAEKEAEESKVKENSEDEKSKTVTNTTTDKDVNTVTAETDENVSTTEETVEYPGKGKMVKVANGYDDRGFAKYDVKYYDKNGKETDYNTFSAIQEGKIEDSGTEIGFKDDKRIKTSKKGTKYVKVQSWTGDGKKNDCLENIIKNSYDLDGLGIKEGSKDYHKLQESVMNKNKNIYDGSRSEVGGTGRVNTVLYDGEKVKLPDITKVKGLSNEVTEKIKAQEEENKKKIAAVENKSNDTNVDNQKDDNTQVDDKNLGNDEAKSEDSADKGDSENVSENLKAAQDSFAEYFDDATVKAYDGDKEALKDKMKSEFRSNFFESEFTAKEKAQYFNFVSDMVNKEENKEYKDTISLDGGEEHLDNDNISRTTKEICTSIIDRLTGDNDVSADLVNKFIKNCDDLVKTGDNAKVSDSVKSNPHVSVDLYTKFVKEDGTSGIDAVSYEDVLKLVTEETSYGTKTDLMTKLVVARTKFTDEKAEIEKPEDAFENSKVEDKMKENYDDVESVIEGYKKNDLSKQQAKALLADMGNIRDIIDKYTDDYEADGEQANLDTLLKVLTD